MSVFISYSHQDSEFAEKLAMELIKRKIPIWIDKWELNVGDSLMDKIQTALTEAACLCVVLSKNSVESTWCKKELNSGLIRELDEKRVVVLPILKEDCTIPLFLKDKMYADFRINFDTGIEQLLIPLSKSFSDILGKVNNKDYITDWAIDWGERGGIFEMHIDSVSYSKDKSWSVISKITLVGSNKMSNRFRQYCVAGLDKIFKNTILELCNEINKGNDLRILISADKPTATVFYVKDKNGYDFEVHIWIRRLGEDTGRDILFDYGNIFEMIREVSMANTPKLTANEEAALRRIILE